MEKSLLTVKESTDGTNIPGLEIHQRSVMLPGESGFDEQSIRIAIETLGDELKMPLMMYRDGFDYEDISDNLDLEIRIVKCRIFFAWQKVKFMLKASQE